MHQRSWFVALLGACALFVMAPHARADGFYVTFSKGGTPITPRMAGAAFDATGQSPIDALSGLPTGQLRVTPVHVEVDSLQIVEPILKAATAISAFDAKLEFTTPDAQGHEQVTMIVQYSNANVAAWLTKFNPQASPKLQNAVDFIYQSVTYSAPPAPPAPGTSIAGKKLPVSSTVAKTAPHISRLIIPANVSPTALFGNVDDAYFQAPNIPGEDSTHPNQIRATAFSMTLVVPRDAQSGLPTGRLMLKAIKISKGAGAASAALQTALTNHSNLRTLSVSFNQHRTGAADLVLATLTLTNANVQSDSLQVASGTTTETLALTYQHADLANNGSDAVWDWETAI